MEHPLVEVVLAEAEVLVAVALLENQKALGDVNLEKSNKRYV